MHHELRTFYPMGNSELFTLRGQWDKKRLDKYTFPSTAHHSSQQTSNSWQLESNDCKINKMIITKSILSFPRSSAVLSVSVARVKRALSTDADKIDYEGIDSTTRIEMEKRHEGIKMNQNSISQFILPGDKMVKTNQKTGTKKMLAIERNMGYFWYLKDLKDTDSKPVVANEDIIPSNIAKVFPPLNAQMNGSLKSLAGKEESLPHFFTSGNRSNDPSAFCTLVGVAFNDYGNKMLPSWIDPFEHRFQADKSRVKTAWLSINEGTALYMLKYFITNASLKTVSEERRDRTLLFFGSCPEFRDVLRMHNNKTGYVFLLDGLGRVRFAGSGKAKDEELRYLFRSTRELAPGLKSKNMITLNDKNS